MEGGGADSPAPHLQSMEAMKRRGVWLLMIGLGGGWLFPHPSDAQGRKAFHPQGWAYLNLTGEWFGYAVNGRRFWVWSDASIFSPISASVGIRMARRISLEGGVQRRREGFFPEPDFSWMVQQTHRYWMVGRYAVVAGMRWRLEASGGLIVRRGFIWWPPNYRGARPLLKLDGEGTRIGVVGSYQWGPRGAVRVMAFRSDYWWRTSRPSPMDVPSEWEVGVGAALKLWEEEE